MSSASHVVGDQSEVLAFLGAAAAHRLAVPPKRIDTHGAIVFLAGEHAYKVKRAVRFPFMDLSTLARRKAACEAEIEVNRANAPEIYLGVVAVTRSAGGLRLGGDGTPVEWVVHMRRFDEEQTLDRVAGRGGLTPRLIADVVRAVLASHDRAPGRDGPAACESLRLYLRQNDAAFAELPDLFPPDRAAALTARSEEALAGVMDLLLERGRQGFVRRCHGDLHLRNIVLLDGRARLFDAIEFDDSIATGDVLYDLAFLVMDLWERGLAQEANIVLNRYLWAGAEAHLDGLAALPLFLSIRAAIRAKVTAAAVPHLARSEQDAMAAQARRYFDEAARFLAPQDRRLVAVGGLSGTGKTTLAGRLAPRFGAAPGAVHLRSDIERKRLASVGETERLPQSSYTPHASEAVYAALLRKAGAALAAGRSVIVDAVFARRDERAAVEAAAARTGVPFSGLWLQAPAAMLTQRVEARRGDASDATAEVVLKQAAFQEEPVAWSRLDASDDIEPTVARAARCLGME